MERLGGEDGVATILAAYKGKCSTCGSVPIVTFNEKTVYSHRITERLLVLR